MTNNQDLLKAIKSGMPQPELMEKFGFKTSTQLKIAYADALVASGEAQGIKKSKRRKMKAPGSQVISVNARGSLVVPKVVIQRFGIEIGTAFEVKKTAAGLRLKIVADTSKE